MDDDKGTFRYLNCNSEPAEWFRSLAKGWEKPSAIVVISAHWEERDQVLVTSSSKHPLLFDYYGFPDYTYEIEYPCPGDPTLAQSIIELLRAGGVEAGAEETRGYDHGVFVPLKLIYPDADIPVVQVSMRASLGVEQHMKIGMLLSDLQEKHSDILVIGSGQATHNLRTMDPSYPPGVGRKEEDGFVKWLKQTMIDEDLRPEDRKVLLRLWEEKAPHARLAHPREEHLLPLHVVAGYVGFSPGKTVYDRFFLGTMSLLSFVFPHKSITSSSDSVLPHSSEV
ncbi:unnamed protein product [Choristocarpus tenellus]